MKPLRHFMMIYMAFTFFIVSHSLTAAAIWPSSGRVALSGGTDAAVAQRR